MHQPRSHLPAGVTLTIVLLVVFLFNACSSASPTLQPVAASFGQTVPLSIGQQAVFESELHITFLQVTRDDRCPPAAAATCDSQGSAQVTIQANNDAAPHFGYPQKIDFALGLLPDAPPWSSGWDTATDGVNGTPQSVGYMYTVGLCPYPESSQDPKMRDLSEYRLYFRADRAVPPITHMKQPALDLPCLQ